MSEYQEVTESIDVPPQVGVEGFLAAIRKILQLPRVTRVEIDGQGHVSYTRYVREEDPVRNIEVDFDTVMPSAVVRNVVVQELDVFGVESAGVCLAVMFEHAAAEHLYPIGFVAGANTVLPGWHQKTTGVRLGQDSVYGLPLYRDRFIPDDVLLLVTAYTRQGALVDARKSYKILMPSREAPLRIVPPVVQPSQEVAVDNTPLLAAHHPIDSEVKVNP